MYKKGAVLLVPFPFTDLSGAKVRPAIIISPGIIDSHIIVVFLTTNPKLKSEYSISVKQSKKNGLKQDSAIIVSKITSLDPKIILGEIGQIETDILKEINKKLLNLFV